MPARTEKVRSGRVNAVILKKDVSFEVAFFVLF